MHSTRKLKMHTIIIKDKENPDFEGHVVIKCDCGWQTDCHTTFLEAIKNRHISLNERRVDK